MSQDCLSFGTKAQITLVLVLALTLSIICFVKKPLVNKDGIYYIEIAQHVARGDWQAATQERDFPFFPSFIALMHLFVSDWVLCGKFVCMMASLLALSIFYFFTRSLLSEKNAFVASLFMAAAPSLQINSGNITRDPFFLVFLLLFFWAYYTARKLGQKKYYIAAFISLIFAGLCRVEGFILLVAYILLLVYRGLRSANRKIKIITSLCVLLLCLLLTLEICTPFSQIKHIKRFAEISEALHAPYELYQKLPIHSVYQSLKDLEDQLPGEDYAANAVKVARNYILLLYAIGMVDSWVGCAYPTFFLLGLLGIFVAFREKRSAYFGLLGWMIFLLVPPYLFLLRHNYLSTRYLIPASIFLYCFAALGFNFLWEAVKTYGQKRGKNFLVSPALCALFLALLLAMPTAKLVLRKGDINLLQEVGRWLAQSPYKHQTILTTDARILFYAGLAYSDYRHKDIFCKDSKIEEIVQKAKELKAQCLILEDQSSAKELGKLVHVFYGKKQNIYVYEFVP